MSKQKAKLISGIFLTIFFVSTFLVNYTIALADVKISGFQSLSLGTWTGTGDREAMTDLCVHNALSSNYKITARGDGTGDAFILGQNGGTGEISYLVHFRRIGDAYVPLLSNSSQSFSGADTLNENCDIGGNNATLRITVPGNAIGSAPAGTYSGRITLILEQD